MKPDFRLANYHTHTPRCMHAVGTEEEYVLEAITVGYDILGFADHTAWPYTSGYVADMRMHISELEGYIATLNALKEKYADKIRIHVGLECEAFPQFYSWLRDTVPGLGVEYLILGNHFDTTDEDGLAYFGAWIDRERAYRYMETTISGMETGLFAYLAHPDLFLSKYRGFDDDARRICRELCEAAKRLDMPLEYNILGYNRQAKAYDRGCMGYSTREFWEIAAETGNRAIIGVDAHKPEQLNCVDLYRRTRGMFDELGIEVLDVLDMPDEE